MKHCRPLLLLPTLFILCLSGCRALSPPDEAEARQLAANEFSAFCKENGFNESSFALLDFTKTVKDTSENRGSIWIARYRATHPDGKLKQDITVFIFASKKVELSFLDYDE